MNQLVRQYCLFIIAGLSLLCLTLPSNAQSQDNSVNDDSNGGFMDLSFGLAAFDSRFVDSSEHLGVVLGLRLNYQWHGFFIENQGVNGLGLPGVGYQFYQDEKWTFDLYSSQIHNGIASGDSNEINGEQDALQQLKPRESDERFGVRTTYYFDDSNVFRVLVVPWGDRSVDGIHLSAWYGKTWQYQNTNFHAILNARYDGHESLDYYYGISGSDISDKFPQYTAGSGVTLGAELGMTVPITKDWVIEGLVRLQRMPDSIYNSPIVANRVEKIAQISFVYVLF